MKLLYEQELHVRKSLVIRTAQLAGGGLLLKMLKHFKVILDEKEFLDWECKTKLVLA